MNVLIVCSGGMSSNALVTKLRKHMNEKGPSEIKIGSCPVNLLPEYINKADMILLSPHMEYLFEDLIKTHPEKSVILIPSQVYGMQKVEVLADIIKNPNKHNEQIHESTNIKTSVAKFELNKILSSINEGMASTLPITVIGSIFLLLRTIPIKAFTDFILNNKIDEVLQLGVNMTTGVISLYTTFFISFHLAKKIKINHTHAALNALICFFIFIGRNENGQIENTFLGVNGIFTAIFIGVLSTLLYKNISKIIDNKRQQNRFLIDVMNIPNLRMLVPTTVSIILSLIVVFLVNFFAQVTPPNFIYKSLQLSLSSFAGNNIFSEMFFTLATSGLWFFGIHGGGIITAITKPIYAPLSLANLYAFSNNIDLPYIINTQFRYMYIFGGAGSTLGLAILMTFFAKSKKMQTIGKISLPLGMFFINEPIIFGIPIVFNPILAIPFILIPTISGLLTFVFMSSGVLPYTIGVEVPWTTPPIISGFIQGGMRLAIWQILMIILSIIIWFPFFRIQDRRFVEDETS